jgi:2-dehydropantoate 2-reductase
VSLRVCVYGAGAVGGHIAGRLARGGATVSVVARGPHLAAMQANGLTIDAHDATFTVNVAASNDPRDLGEQDAVIVAVKAPALPSVAAGIAPLLGAKTQVVFAINGIPWWYFHAHGGALDDRRLPLIDPDDALRRAVGMERVVGGVIYSACTVTAPGVVHVENPNSNLIFGEPDGSVSERVETLAAILRAGGMGMKVTQRIRDAIWTKLLMNLSSGPIAVLTARPPCDYYLEPLVVDAVRAIVAEGTAIAAALGCTTSIDIEAVIARGRSSTHKPSILQDLELGRPMEIDGIYTVPLELAGMMGVATPVLDLLVALMKVRARGAGLYGA